MKKFILKNSSEDYEKNEKKIKIGGKMKNNKKRIGGVMKKSMKKFVIFLFVVLQAGVLLAQTNVEGDVSGTWTVGNSPYNVIGDLNVPNGQTLTIEPGVLVEFQGHYMLNVQGRVLALGTQQDTIVFTVADTTGYSQGTHTGWLGIRFDETSASNDSSKIVYCKLEYAKVTGDYGGGAIFLHSFHKLLVDRCNISHNKADFGGGICCWYYSDPKITNTTISNNRINLNGGGVFCFQSSPTLNNNTISGNSTPKSGYSGGGIYCSDNSNPIIINNIITGNSSGTGGGITYSGSNSNPILSDNIISDNSAHLKGGGIYCWSSNPGMHNNTISGNSAFEGGGIYTGGVLNATWSNNTISNNIAEYGGGIYDNSTYTSDPIWTNNIFDGNSATVEGGGIWCTMSNPTLNYNTIINNSSDGEGGGIFCYRSNPIMNNNTISNNSANNGGGMYCTFYSSPVLTNTILWQNSAASGNEVYLDENYSDPDFYYCDVEGGTAAFGLNSGVTYNGTYENNIDADPLFVYPGIGDYHLTIISPCIDAGDPSYPFDPDGTIADIGAFYFDQSQIILDAHFTADVTSGYAPLTVQFTDLSSGNPISWEWDFQNDGTIDSYVQNPEWIYTETGTYTVSLTVNDGSCEDTNIKENYITVMAGPTADFTADVTSGYAPLEVNFEDQSTQGLDPIVEWYWDFGDGNTSSLQNPTNIYQNVGLYTVNLTVTDADGLTDTETKTDYIVLHTTIINIPSDFATIQEGINASVNGDTVLVHPGTYVEHINFNGKAITVASLFITTQNTTYISQTIINGNNIGRDLTLDVVTFNNGEDSTSVLTGVTITNGNYGIYCYDYSSPTISNNSIINNGSWGIYCSNYSSPSISNNTISNNSAGIECAQYSSPLISNNTISHHSDGYGYGIYCTWSYPTIINNTINYNEDGIYCTRSHPAISNNTIDFNSVGIECWDFAGPTISKNTISNSNNYGISCIGTARPFVLNNIIYNNSTGIDADAIPQSLEYNLFWLNGNNNSGYVPASFGEIVTVNANGDSCDVYYNLFMDPLFVDPANFNYHLTENSPCIDAGNPDPIYYDPDGTIADIGAFYFEQSQILNANFSASPTSGIAPLTVNFTDLSTGNPTNWEWDFQNDGTIDSYVQNPEWVYTEIGIYTVSLTVSDGTNTDSEIKTDYISVTSETSHALQFDGTDDYAQVSDFNYPAADLTLEAWIKPDQFDEVREIIYGINFDNYNTIQFRLEGDGRLLYGESPDWTYVVTPNPCIELNEWNHIAMVRENGLCKLYVNGVQLAEGIVNEGVNPTEINIGGRAHNMSRFYSGDIDEVRIWAIARTQPEIQANMTNYLEGTETGLIAYWRMNEGTGQTAFDLSGSGYDLQLGSTPQSDISDPAWIATDWPYGITLQADFSATPTSGNAPLTVNFTDLSTGGLDLLFSEVKDTNRQSKARNEKMIDTDNSRDIISWEWDFQNDGTIDSYVQNPEWIYTEPGIYTVSLTVSDGTNTDTEIKTDYISVYNVIVGPLLTATWQVYSWPYNAYYPEDPDGVNGHVGNSCGPTAMALMMHYWGYPAQGTDSLSFYDDEGHYWSANFGETTYEWSNMPDYLPYNSTEDEYSATATLMYHSAVSMYDVYGTGKSLSELTNSFKNYFNYSEQAEVLFRDDYTPAEWDAIFKNELDNGRPIMIEGWTANSAPPGQPGNHEGHYFICDGYNSLGDYHIKWNFGNSEGYYPLYEFGSYNAWNWIIVGFEPESINADFSADVTSGNAPLTVNFTDLTTGDPISWEWDFQNDGTIDSYVQNPEFIYTEAGTYSVSLTVSDGTNTDTEIKTDYISVYSPSDTIYVKQDGTGDVTTIQAGINIAQNGMTVLVYPGTYIENINFNGKNITVGSLFLTSQDTTYISQTIIDGNQNGRVVTFNSGEELTALLTGFTITNGYSSGSGGGILIYDTNPTITYCDIIDNSADNYGGGIACLHNSAPVLQYLNIMGNNANNSGGLNCYMSNPTIEYILLSDNTANITGGAIVISDCPELIINNITISGNTAQYGGAVMLTSSYLTIKNSILWNNQPEEIYFNYYYDPNTLDISYTDIQGGEAGIVAVNGSIIWGNGNLDTNPLFVDPSTGDFHLTSNSPCIDAGDPNSPLDPDGTISDMGAYYFHQPQEEYDISGNIGYFSDSDPVPDVVLELTGDNTYSTTTAESGDYLFNDIPGGNYISTPSKADDLGGLSGTDASRIARYVALLYEFDCIEMITADVSMNGNISGTDASRVARYVALLITDLNTDGIHWVFTPEPIPECDTWPPIVYESTREYTPLESDLIDEDFIGIRLGDVSGNWSLVVRESFTYNPSEITNIDTDINSTLRIPVVIEEATAIEGIDISIAFNPEVLQLTELTLKEGILDNKNYAIETNLNEAGKGIMVIYAQKELVSENGAVAFIEFDIIGEVGTSSDIYFTKFDVNETEASGGFKVIDFESNEIITKRLAANVVETIPDKFALYPNYPNPFTSRTVIRYDLPKDSHIIIQIYNVKGQLVEELVNGVESAGRKEIEWNAKGLSSGIYFYKLSTENKTIIKKMLLLR